MILPPLSFGIVGWFAFVAAYSVGKSLFEPVLENLTSNLKSKGGA